MEDQGKKNKGERCKTKVGKKIISHRETINEIKNLQNLKNILRLGRGIRNINRK